MPAAALSRPQVTSFRFRDHAFRQLTRSKLGPIGTDLQRRGLRVTRAMKANASGRPGPNIRTETLVNSIAFLRFDADVEGLFADIGPRGFRVVKRGYNYSTLLEFGNPGGRVYGPRPAYPFIRRSLDAAR